MTGAENPPPQTLGGSFSAVSKPNFASKYALESSRRDLHNALLCTVFESQFFRKTFAKFSSFFSQFLLFFRDFSRFFRNFAKILPEFLEISRKSIKFANFYEFQGVPDKTRTQIRQETRRRPVVLPLRGAEVLVAVRGPSPGEGGREKEPAAQQRRRMPPAGSQGAL